MYLWNYRLQINIWNSFSILKVFSKIIYYSVLYSDWCCLFLKFHKELSISSPFLSVSGLVLSEIYSDWWTVLQVLLRKPLLEFRWMNIHDPREILDILKERKIYGGLNVEVRKQSWEWIKILVYNWKYGMALSLKVQVIRSWGPMGWSSDFRHVGLSEHYWIPQWNVDIVIDGIYEIGVQERGLGWDVECESHWHDGVLNSYYRWGSIPRWEREEEESDDVCHT